jgi:hypothetical protein
VSNGRSDLSCSEATLALGAYLVGALDPRERADVEAHLAACPACREEMAELAPLPGLMSRITAEDVVAGPPVADDALLDRLLAAAARERRVARHRRWLAAVAAVVVLAGGTAAGVGAYDAATAPPSHTFAAASGPVHMSVRLSPTAAGTSVRLRLSGVASEQRCRLVAVSDTGSREVAGSWEANYSGVAQIDGTTWISYRHLRRLVVETFDGRELVGANVPT